MGGVVPAVDRVYPVCLCVVDALFCPVFVDSPLLVYIVLAFSALSACTRTEDRLSLDCYPPSMHPASDPMQAKTPPTWMYQIIFRVSIHHYIEH